MIQFLLFLLLAAPVHAATLTWTNQAVYDSVLIERAPSCTGTFVQVGSVVGTLQTFDDPVGKVGNCWRVRATKGAEFSNYSNLALWMIAPDTLVSLACTQEQVATPPPSSGLVAAYNFNAGSGTTLADRSGNNNNGTVSNGAWTTSGKYGSALVFNGTSSVVTIPDTNSLDLNQFTLETWVYPTATMSGWKGLLIKEGANGWPYFLYANGSPSVPAGMAFLNGGEQIVMGTVVLPLNTWTFLSTSYDGATLKLYVNGAQVAGIARTGTTLVSTGALKIGGNSQFPTEFFQGRIDNVRIYNRALTSSEIQTDMTTAIP